ncbi:hypothetical protein [Streptomyces roseolus]|uniref:hypothetical protein n=1 Tax=Streptomyces roseolus TaxID=67358 RepID=UPI0016759724|nr:hypothetical protein [Streptomyces roseolus]GGR19080.1 hypothetical protein GCM10010282_09180 [Streptomyces roseolus]
MHVRRKAAGLLAGVVLVAGGLLATAPAQAAAPADRATSDTASTAPAAPAAAQAEAGVLATAPTISPAAERVRYVTDGTYSCPTGRLCARVWDPTQGKYKVFDLYYCNTYSLSYWGSGGDGGGFKNYQTNGTVARFYNSSGGVVHSSTAPDIAPATWSWDPIWKIKNC